MWVCLEIFNEYIVCEVITLNKTSGKYLTNVKRRLFDDCLDLRFRLEYF